MSRAPRIDTLRNQIAATAKWVQRLRCRGGHHVWVNDRYFLASVPPDFIGGDIVKPTHRHCARCGHAEARTPEPSAPFTVVDTPDWVFAQTPPKEPWTFKRVAYSMLSVLAVASVVLLFTVWAGLLVVYLYIELGVWWGSVASVATAAFLAGWWAFMSDVFGL